VIEARGVDFILISVSDVKRSRVFYGETLGMKPAAEWPPSWYEFEAGDTTIAIGTPPPGAPQPPYQGGMTVAVSVADAKGAMEELRAKGVMVLQEVQETGTCFMGLIADPDGNGIWIHQRKDGTAG
jgi:predicted enzyme related to lactoylglutathione lyase